MRWRRSLNDLLERGTGLRVMRPPVAPDTPRIPIRPPLDRDLDRLLRRPVFLLSSVRSGSTLLRVILNGHSRIHAPIELHARRIAVQLTTPPVEQAMAALDLNVRDLEHLLWDRLLHRQLAHSGKQVLVEKTPSNVFAVQRLVTCWPDARFVFLIRHPLAIARSWHEGDPENRSMDAAVTHVLGYVTALEAARAKYPGLTVRYEDLTADPVAEARRICEYLEVGFEPQMLDYGSHGITTASGDDFVKGIGDWREKIRTGQVQPGRALPRPDEIPPPLIPISRDWRYLEPSS